MSKRFVLLTLIVLIAFIPMTADVGTGITLDVVNDRISIGKTNPQFPLDIKGQFSSNTQNAAAYITFNQPSGGGPFSLPTGLLVEGGAVSGGTYSHSVGIFSWLRNLTDVQDFRVDYAGEFRIDMDVTGSVASGNTPYAYGVLGLATLDAADNTNTTVIGGNMVARVGEHGVGGTGVAVGLIATAEGGLININAQFGSGNVEGDNASVEYRGYITDGASGATAAMAVDDFNDEFLISATDEKLDGIAIQLRDTAGDSAFRVRNGNGIPVFDVDSNGKTQLASSLQVGVGAQTSVTAAIGGRLHIDNSSNGTTAITTEQVLKSFLLPANSLSNNGSGIRITAWGTTAANNNNKTVAIKWGGRTIHQESSPANNRSWLLKDDVYRTGSASQDIIGALGIWDVSGAFSGFQTDTEDLTTDTLIEVVGQNAVPSANDIVVEGLRVEFLP